MEKNEVVMNWNCDEKGIGNRHAMKNKKMNTHSGFYFPRPQQRKDGRNLSFMSVIVEIRSS